MKTDISVLVGGAAGQGLHTIGAALARGLHRSGLHVFSVQDYYSRVRGGHNFVRIRAATEPVSSYCDRIDVLVALDELTVKLHRSDLGPDGIIVADVDGGNEPPDERTLSLPLAELAETHGGRKVMANSVATGAAWWLLGGEIDTGTGVIQDTFSGLGPDIADANVRAFLAGVDRARTYRADVDRTSRDPESSRILISGNEAVSLGALAAGCQFVSSYPMTPASSIVEQIAGADAPVVFEQAEDEIAAINMAIGAGYCGARSMVATSGGGFSLMAEGLSLAGCTETPIVIVLGQRPGPATGLATRTEQGELLFSLTAGHGEFPRVLLAPGTAEQAFWHTIRAFNLADRFQIPVIILTDQHLADSAWSTAEFDLSQAVIDRGEWLTDGELAAMSVYRRHLFTDSGVSPRARPGQAGRLVITTGNEHDERGLSTEDPVMRRAMVDKRLSKLRGLGEEVEPPLVYGSDAPSLVLLTWGSAYGACREAVDQLNRQGERARMIHLGQLWPFPRYPVLTAIGGAERVVCVEMNATSQLGRLLRQEAGVVPDSAVLKYDGRPLNAAFIMRELAAGGAQGW